MKEWEKDFNDIIMEIKYYKKGDTEIISPNNKNSRLN